MRAMTYIVNTVHGPIPEMSIFVENYQHKTLFVFMNRITGPRFMSAKDGQEYINSKVDKATANVLDISSDTYLVYDLIDSLKTVNYDVSVLFNKYLKGVSATVSQEETPPQEEPTPPETETPPTTKKGKRS
jgi:hypothetical protein